MNIKIFYDNIDFRLKGSNKIKKLIKKVISNEKKNSDDLIFIFTTDDKLIEINKEFLKHNYYTDIIAFNYSNGRNIRGEIYISIDTVKYNAYNYKVSLIIEILRVMIHGTLHLCGYDDRTDKMQKAMRKLEEKWISEYKKS